MDAAKLQDKIYAGYAKAAKRIGYIYDVYRPVVAADPLTAKVASLNASFSAQEWSYTRPNLPDKPYWYCLVDGRLTQVGDYLVRGASTHFIAGMQAELPILTVECNAQVWLARPAASDAVGDVGYSGACEHVDSPVLGTPGGPGWPASILFGGRTRRYEPLPASSDEHGYRILLPASMPAQIRAADVLTDDMGRRLIVVGAERTEQLWRLDTTEVHT
ncbi:hypothetical protein BKK79_19980 [Cupriavidus sp. USMAA2-4]|uniref:hypothetical protein n=1 Tax=Cupriavidus sp. USMAA2-4 TaxID=876364 RepID=UPI0008A6969F|nr:hypothetical protein [Cupriavidus sp. USMAA2-4]AOY93827.1 hypothetical protein BKK79_19980 [Cupriavidus sp. USMAA2-4]